MLQEVPLPSIPADTTSPDYLNYFSLLESYHPEYFDDLPSEIMNHFRTSTARPYYDTEDVENNELRLSSPGPVTCSDNIMTCNNNLPRFSISDLSKLSILSGVDGVVKKSARPREPTQLLPPSGRVPYPTFRPEYEDVLNQVTPLMFSPRQYVPSSTIRPAPDDHWSGNILTLAEQDKSSKSVQNHKITTYRPVFSLTTEKSKKYSNESIQRIKKRLSEILERLRLKESKKMMLQNLYQQRRKNGQRYYPDNNINPHLPVTTPSSAAKNNSSISTDPEDYFTVKDRRMNGSGVVVPGYVTVLLCIVTVQCVARLFW